MSVSKEIKMYLIENDITQRSIANMTGISAAKLNMSLNDQRRFTFEEFELILGAIGETADKFLRPKYPDQRGA